VLFTLVFFGLNAVWEWVLSPLFAHLGSGLLPFLVQALVRTLVFAVLVIVVIRRLHISPEVDALLAKIHLSKH
jgi:hypothetical protein